MYLEIPLIPMIVTGYTNKTTQNDFSHSATGTGREKALQSWDAATARPNKQQQQQQQHVARCSWDSAASLEQRSPLLPLKLPFNCSIAVCLFFKALVSFKRSCSWSWLISCCHSGWIKILSSWPAASRASFCLGRKKGRQAEGERVSKTDRQTGNSCLCLWLVRLFASPCSVSAISSLSLTIFSFLSTLWSLLSTFACQAQEQDGTGRDSTGQRQPAYWDHMF